VVGPAAGDGATTRTRVHVKPGRRRSVSSTRWLQRQLNDPYVAAARKAGYRSRAAYKLREIDDRFGFLRPGLRVVDLGAAPGGWTQVALERVAPGRGRGAVVAVDVSDMAPLAGAEVVRLDVGAPGAAADLRAALGGPADVVLSDMAGPATGHTATDHLRVMVACEAAFEIAQVLLRPGGAFIAKVLQGGTEHHLLADLKRRFRSVRHVKPKASRSGSAETYLVALSFRPEPPAGQST
jgi:23S rRNA (uridine2552-2'-O)-methyltransferase